MVTLQNDHRAQMHEDLRIEIGRKRLHRAKVIALSAIKRNRALSQKKKERENEKARQYALFQAPE